MRRTFLKAIAAFSAAAMMISACPAVYAADNAKAETTVTKSSFSSSYCEISGSYKDGKVTVTWDKVAGASSYRIYRENGTGTFTFLAETSKCTYTDKKTVRDRLYRYKVYAMVGAERSVPSEILHVGISSKGKAVIYTFDIPKDYEARRDFPVSSFDTYDKNTYGKPQQQGNSKLPSPTPPKYAYTDEITGAGEGIDSDMKSYAPAEEYTDDYEEDYDYADDADAGAGEAFMPDDYDHGRRKPKKPQYYYGGDDNITAGTLTAGRHNDNDDYKQFTKLLSSDEWSECVSERGFTLDTRYTVKVKDESGKPVENASVELRSTGQDGDVDIIFAAKTNNKGVAYIFTGFAGNERADSIVVPMPDGSLFTQPLKSAKSVINVTYKGKKTAKKQLDLMLTIDSTGSMSDEMKYLEAEFKDVVERVSKDNGNIAIRTSVNFYRDVGDEYIYRAYNFRTKADTVTKSIGHERATGGGDFPEAVHTALDISVNDHKWDKDSTKIMFLVLDAPPHYDDKITEEYFRHVAEASAKGIRIIPIVSSGSDTDTEYLMRTTAAATGGTYIFLTDDSGVGGSHAEPSVDQYEVVKLNDLMVKVIDEYLA